MSTVESVGAWASLPSIQRRCPARPTTVPSLARGRLVTGTTGIDPVGGGATVVVAGGGGAWSVVFAKRPSATPPARSARPNVARRGARSAEGGADAGADADADAGTDTGAVIAANAANPLFSSPRSSRSAICTSCAGADDARLRAMRDSSGTSGSSFGGASPIGNRGGAGGTRSDLHAGHRE